MAIEVGCVVASETLRDTWGKQTATVDELYHFAEARNNKNKNAALPKNSELTFKCLNFKLYTKRIMFCIIIIR